MYKFLDYDIQGTIDYKLAENSGVTFVSFAAMVVTLSSSSNNTRCNSSRSRCSSGLFGDSSGSSSKIGGSSGSGAGRSCSSNRISNCKLD